MIDAHDRTGTDAGSGPSAVIDRRGNLAVLQRERALARSLGDASAEATSLCDIAELMLVEGRPDDALTVGIEARELARDAGVTLVEVRALHLEGRVQAAVGNLDDALDSLLTALDLARRSDVDDLGAERAVLCTVATVHRLRGDLDRASTVAEAAVAVGAELPHDDAEVAALHCLAEARVGSGEFGAAIGCGEAAVALARSVRSERLSAVSITLAAGYVGLRLWDRAAGALDDAARLVAGDTPADRLLTADVALGRSAVAAGRNDLAGALAHASEALDAIDPIARATVAANVPVLDRIAGLRCALRALDEMVRLCRAAGRLDDLVVHLDRRITTMDALHGFTIAQRMLAQQIAHDAEAGRIQAEVHRLRTSELDALVSGRTYDLEEYQLEAFQRLAVLAEFRDTDTGEHTVRVGDLAGEIADELGEAAPWSHRLRLAARLHDIGKVAVPDAILLKPGKLTDDEMAVMKTHTTVGAEILGGSVSPLIQLAAEVALNHHEWWDGRGYPNGSAGDDIPLSGRIVSVADVFDALLSARPYKRAWTKPEATQYIVDGRGAQFEPRIVDAFVRVALRRHPELVDQISLTA